MSIGLGRLRQLKVAVSLLVVFLCGHALAFAEEVVLADEQLLAAFDADSAL